jgi:hypothetical protein
MADKAPQNEPYTVKMARMEETLKHMIDQIGEIKNLLQKHIESEKELADHFAAKWVENAMMVVIGAFSLGIIGAILKVIMI